MSESFYCFVVGMITGDFIAWLSMTLTWNFIHKKKMKAVNYE